MKKILVCVAIVLVLGTNTVRAESIPLTRSVINTIVKYSYEYGVNADMAFNLAWFESKLAPTAKNPTSSAKGIYQFIDSTWKNNCEGDVENYEDNIKCAMRIIGLEKGISHWTCDLNTRRYLQGLGYLDKNLSLRYGNK